MSETLVVEQTPETSNIIQNELKQNSISEDQPVNPIYGYMAIGVIIVVILIVIYLAYEHFINNTEKSEGFVKGQEQERTDLVMDFNLQQVVDNLNELQRKIVKNLSTSL